MSVLQLLDVLKCLLVALFQTLNGPNYSQIGISVMLYLMRFTSIVLFHAGITQFGVFVPDSSAAL